MVKTSGETHWKTDREKGWGEGRRERERKGQSRKKGHGKLLPGRGPGGKEALKKEPGMRAWDGEEERHNNMLGRPFKIKSHPTNRLTQFLLQSNVWRPFLCHQVRWRKGPPTRLIISTPFLSNFLGIVSDLMNLKNIFFGWKVLFPFSKGKYASGQTRTLRVSTYWTCSQAGPHLGLLLLDSF